MTDDDGKLTDGDLDLLFSPSMVEPRYRLVCSHNAWLVFTHLWLRLMNCGSTDRVFLLLRSRAKVENIPHRMEFSHEFVFSSNATEPFVRSVLRLAEVREPTVCKHLERRLQTNDGGMFDDDDGGESNHASC